MSWIGPVFWTAILIGALIAGVVSGADSYDPYGGPGCGEAMNCETYEP